MENVSEPEFGPTLTKFNLRKILVPISRHTD
jgi:hypothetical protein